MPGNNRILSQAPVIVKHRQIRSDKARSTRQQFLPLRHSKDLARKCKVATSAEALMQPTL